MARRWLLRLTVMLVPAALLLGPLPVGEAGAWPSFPRPKAPAAPDRLGPYAVGRSTFTATDAARKRELTVDAWYPADRTAVQGRPRSVYDLLLAGITSKVAYADVPVSGKGPFPLVVFSHGNDGLRFQSFFLAEALASHGFVVVSPDHAGNTAFDVLFGTTDPLAQVALDRPRDVSFLITRMLQRSRDARDAFSGRIDPSRIGVSGHSFGGFTALAVASGFAGIPRDPRVRAIVPISPASSILSDSQLSSIRVPTMIVGGTSDRTTPLDPESARPYRLVSARPRFRVDVHKAGHASFTEICAIADALRGAGLPPEILDFLKSLIDEGCAPELIPIVEAHRLTNLYAVSFLKRYVAGDARYGRFLTEAYTQQHRLAADVFHVAACAGWQVVRCR